MKLMVNELTSFGIEQVITPAKNTVIHAIRPHLYRHNLPAGTLKLVIYDAADDLVAESESLDIADIGTMSYFHGYVRFNISAYLAKDTQYTLSLVGEDGYTFSESAYCGWVNGHDLAKYPIDGVPAGHFNYPMDYEVWERTTK